MADKIILYKKADRLLTFTWPTGTNLNGSTVLFTAKCRVGGSEDDSDAKIVSEVTVNTETNVAQISLSDSDTDVAPGTYVADIKKVSSGGGITGYGSFDVEVRNTVTQRSS
jgi:hypothetical protein